MSKENNLPSTLKMRKKISEKEKQIDEMAKILHEGMKPLKETYGTNEIASILYNAGYRKQSDVVRCKDCHYCYQVGNIKACRHWNSHSTTDDAYCSYAKMKGGE